MKELLEAGVHFGHQTKRWEPEDERSTSSASAIEDYIIDLQKTLKMFQGGVEV